MGLVDLAEDWRDPIEVDDEHAQVLFHSGLVGSRAEGRYCGACYRWRQRRDVRAEGMPEDEREAWHEETNAGPPIAFSARALVTIVDARPEWRDEALDFAISTLARHVPPDWRDRVV